ncbi:MAG: sigma-70 family RNA polymerase sigma factor [Cyclobacteriaceae bacterium]
MIDPVSHTTTDEHVWLAFREGSEHAFDAIYEVLFPVLFNYGCRLCQDKEVVKDCIQNIFIEIWQKRSQVKEVRSLKHYFLKIMRRKVLNDIKSRQKDRLESFSFCLEGDPMDQLLYFMPQSPELDGETSSIASKGVKVSVDKLSSRKKEVILLKFYENLTYTEISEVMELKEPKYARQLLYRALEDLRKDLQMTSWGLSVQASRVLQVLCSIALIDGVLVCV